MDSLLDEIGDAEKAKELFRKALSIESSHMQCTLYMGEMEPTDTICF